MRDTGKFFFSIAGRWMFALDREDAGESEKWYLRNLEQTICLPGSLQEQGFGDDITRQTQWVSSLHDPYWYKRTEYEKYAGDGNVKVPFLLQPKKHYVGCAWYEKEIEIPSRWEGRRVTLYLERPHWKTSVWLDGRCLGSRDSLSVAHVYDFGLVRPGSHRLAVRVDNRNFLHLRPDSHSITDGTGGAWNGIAGKIELRSSSPVYIDDVQVFPDVKSRTARVAVRIGNRTGKPGTGVLSSNGAKAAVNWGPDGGAGGLTLKFDGQTGLWDEFDRQLCHISVALSGENADDSRTETFGFREIKTIGNRFFINGRRTHFRCTHDSGCAPLTGYPPTDTAYWKRIITICQQHGLNMIRFHSWCPPEAAFEAADELGFYFQPECGLWAEMNPGSDITQWLYAESDRICREYGNHPSFVLLTSGNEPSGAWYDVLPQWAHHCRMNDPRRLYSFCTGREAPVPREGMQAYHYWNRQKDADFITLIRVGWDGLRGPKNWDGLDYSRNANLLRMPAMGHEVGQWCAYPNYEEIRKYTGVLRPGCYEIFRGSLAENGLLGKAHDFYMASGKLQLLCYKEEIEANLRTPGIGGFELLDLHDYPGQGMAFVGIRDMFWDKKDYASPEEFRRFCGRTVPLARFYKRVFTNDETAVIPIEAYHYEEKPLDNVTVLWKVTGLNGAVVESGEIPGAALPLDGGIPVGSIALDFTDYPVPGQFRLTVRFKDTEAENGWDFWVYPAKTETCPPDDILVTEHFDEKTREMLQNGGKVLYFAADELSWESPPLPFEPVFWNRQFKPIWNRTLGLLVHPGHPALEKFPTEYFQNFQWREIIKPDCRAVNMAGLPKELEPIVEPVDDWNRNLKLGMLFECRVGKGRLMVCSAKLLNKPNVPQARQLLHSLLGYMESTAFHPAVTVKEEQISGLLYDRGRMAELGAQAAADSQEKGCEAANAITGDPHDYWTTPDTPYPHELTVTLGQPVRIYGFWYMQQQNNYLCLGHVRDYRIEAGDDPEHLETVIQGRLQSMVAPGKVRFQRPVTAKCVRFVALSNFRDCGRAAMAVFSLITDPPVEDFHRCADGKCKENPTEFKKAVGVDLDDPTDE